MVSINKTDPVLALFQADSIIILYAIIAALYYIPWFIHVL